MDFSYKIKTEGGNTQIDFCGDLNENAELPDTAKKFSGELRVNLKQVTGLNSLGCRKWIHWFKTVTTEGGVALVHCPALIIGQINILSGFVPDDVAVESFYVPYTCDQCGRSHAQFVESSAVFGADGSLQVPAEMPCPQCSGILEIEYTPQTYFSFLTKKLVRRSVGP